METWKQRRKAQNARGRERKRKSRKEEPRRKKIPVREVFRKPRNGAFVQRFVGDGRQAGSLKRPVRSHLPRWETKNCTPLWRETLFQVKNVKKNDGLGALLEVGTPKNLDSATVRSTFWNKHVKNMSDMDHFWKSACRKIARPCGPKHMSKSKRSTHIILGLLLGGKMSKKCRPVARSARPSRNPQNMRGSAHCWRIGVEKRW